MSAARDTTARGRLQRVSLIDTIADELSVRILGGEIGPGTRLREIEICDELGVSRQSLRSAMARLSAEGLLRHEMNRGYWVPVLTRDDAIDIFEFRELLEVEAARRLAANVDRIVPVREALAAMVDMTEADWPAYHDAHARFHAAIIAGAESPRLSAHYDILSTEARLCLLPPQPAREITTPQHELARHRRIVEVLETGDPDDAAAAISDHLWSGFDKIYPPAGGAIAG